MGIFSKLSKAWKKGKKLILPVAGAAIGSMIPGVGTSLGATIGSALSGFSAASVDPNTSWEGGGGQVVRNDSWEGGGGPVAPPAEPAAIPPPFMGSPSAGTVAPAGSAAAPPPSSAQQLETAAKPGTNWSQWGPVLSAGITAGGQLAQNMGQIAQADKQMDFQAEQTGTAYQRAVKDMQAAGLNPMLAYSQGGAQSGGGAQATLGNVGGAGVASALQAASTVQSIENQRAQADLYDAQAKQVDSERLLNILRDPLIRAQTHGTMASAKQAESLANLAASQLVGQEQQNFIGDQTMGAKIEEQKAKSVSSVWAAVADELGIPEARAMSKFWQSDWGSTVSPYLRDAGGVTSSVARLLRLGR